MPYTLKTQEQFNKELSDYIQKKPLLVYEDKLLDNFSSQNLSDLYKLIKDLDKSNLDKPTYNKLINILKTFSIDEKEIFPEVDSLTNTITH